jgi:RNase P subunit RPR2
VHGMKKFCALFLFSLIGSFCVNSYAQVGVTVESDKQVQFQSSKTCAKCHLDIYSYWKESLHGDALGDNIFQSAFMLALKQRGDEARELCLDCHTPTTITTGDQMLEQPISRESITCDFCHRISEVKLEGQNKVELTSEGHKYGPLPSATPPNSHPTIQSDLFKDSKFCAACHQWKNENGIAILNTYQEWLDGPYPEKDTHCQNCHMPLVPGSITENGKENDKINSHNLAGGHSVTQVAKAAKVKIASVSRVPSGLHVVVEVSNVGSGHMLPTGMPTRSLVLEVKMLGQNGVVAERREYVFKRTILDDKYKEIKNDADMILNGAIISKDNRIPPGGTASIPFDFAAAPGRQYTITANLRYQYKPLILKEEEISIGMDNDSSSVK